MDVKKRLSALYGEMGEIELLELKASFDDLTDIAQQVLREELEKRQLWDLPAEPAAPSAERKKRSMDELAVTGVVAGEYDTVKEAKLAAFVLELAGIEAAFVDGQGFDMRMPSVRVAPEDAERAEALLAEPVSDETRAEFEVRLHAPDFELPVCPHCASEAVLLEAVEPHNLWFCEECGGSWEDRPGS
jgi:hypothetical protein